MVEEARRHSEEVRRRHIWHTSPPVICFPSFHSLAARREMVTATVLEGPPWNLLVEERSAEDVNEVGSPAYFCTSSRDVTT